MRCRAVRVGCATEERPWISSQSAAGPRVDLPDWAMFFRSTTFSTLSTPRRHLNEVGTVRSSAEQSPGRHVLSRACWEKQCCAEFSVLPSGGLSRLGRLALAHNVDYVVVYTECADLCTTQRQIDGALGVWFLGFTFQSVGRTQGSTVSPFFLAGRA
ncbi:hypothetical protein P280DRAFT_266028 [Massarina eburnea CBS 473.64]|uniref:Uncharacterized protein n=1 Tax=Massarina eburnea CBS 473.64 TaxID=1395130 RepID=A0A6A6S5C5_9PLEO|nr:hypothetical protein P280DRAFT_266028 [Massarina eburnea CBS 473.64]